MVNTPGEHVWEPVPTTRPLTTQPKTHLREAADGEGTAAKLALDCLHQHEP